MTKNFDLGRLDIGYYLVIGIWLLVILEHLLVGSYRQVFSRETTPIGGIGFPIINEGVHTHCEQPLPCIR